MISEEDDPAFQFPADLNKAEKHRIANRIFKGPIPEGRLDRQNMERCECCNRRVGKKQYEKGFFYSPRSDLRFLGPGIPLFFVFIKNAAISLLIFIFVFSLYAILSDADNQKCTAIDVCITNIFLRLNLSNRNINKNNPIQTILITAFLLGYFCIKQRLIYQIRLEKQKLEKILISPSDYSILIQGLPKEVTEDDIKEMIKDQQRTMTSEEFQAANKLRVAKIVLSYDPQEYLRRRQRQEKRFLKAKAKDSLLPFEFADIPKPSETGDFAVVVFDSPLSKEVFLEGAAEGDFKVVFGSCESAGRHKVKGKSVVVKRAPQPQDIIWENAAIPVRRRIRNIILSYLLMAVILTSGGILQYYLQRQNIRLERLGVQSIYAYIPSLVLIVYGIVIQKILHFLASKQGRQTKTLMNQSLLKKACYYSFLNIGIVFVIAYYFTDGINTIQIQSRILAKQPTFFLILNATQPTLLNLIIAKLELPKSIKRFFIRKGLLKSTQKQANQSYERPEFEYAIKYSYIIKTFWITLFYAPFVPAIVSISIIGIIVYYFTEKELFRTSYSIPNMVSSKIAETAIGLLDLCGFIILAGQIGIILYAKYYYNASMQNWNVLEIVSLAVAFALFVFIIAFPALKFNIALFPLLEQLPPKKNYGQVKNQFVITYQMSKPYKCDETESRYSIKKEAQQYRLIQQEEKQSIHSH